MVGVSGSSITGSIQRQMNGGIIYGRETKPNENIIPHCAALLLAAVKSLMASFCFPALLWNRSVELHAPLTVCNGPPLWY